MRIGKIAIVSWTIYPWTTGSSIVVNNIAKTFTKDELILYGEKEPMRKCYNWQINYPKLYHTNPNINIFGKGQTHLRWLKLNKTIREFTHICLQENVTKIISVFPDEFYMFVAYKVSKKLNLPFYTWFHNTYYENRKYHWKLIAKFLQFKFLSHSKLNFIISDGLHQFYSANYPQFKFSVLQHGFTLPTINNKVNIVNSTKTYKFLLTGSLNASCKDALQRMCEVVIKNKQDELHIFSGTKEEEFSKIGIKGTNVFYHGFVDEIEFYKKFKEFDIALLPHGLSGNRSDVEFKTIFPTRLIPLLISGLPILAHCPANIYLTDFLKKTNCALVVTNPSPEELNHSINLLKNDKLLAHTLVENALIISHKFKIENVKKILLESIY